MASTETAPTSRRHLAQLAIVSSLALAAVAVGGWSVWSFVRHESSYLAAESHDRALRREYVQVRHAQERLARLGTHFSQVKGLVYSDIDLTGWKGRDEDLQLLQPFVFLEELGTSDDYTGGYGDRQWLKINANGTSLTDAAVPFLVRLKNLRTLDIKDTQISDEGVRRLGDALPLCKITK